mmetsp:Transcript_16469/g.45141  ORF Transcript_16469/g.45141 Transcript_16469/m.45141 type:complete len:230 (+) Transcript_16469:872-1561(+)
MRGEGGLKGCLSLLLLLQQQLLLLLISKHADAVLEGTQQWGGCDRRRGMQGGLLPEPRQRQRGNFGRLGVRQAHSGALLRVGGGSRSISGYHTLSSCSSRCNHDRGCISRSFSIHSCHSTLFTLHTLPHRTRLPFQATTMPTQLPAPRPPCHAAPLSTQLPAPYLRCAAAYTAHAAHTTYAADLAHLLQAPQLATPHFAGFVSPCLARLQLSQEELPRGSAAAFVQVLG